MMLPPGSWSPATTAARPKIVREGRPSVLVRDEDAAVAIPAYLRGVWLYTVVSGEDAWACAFNWYVTAEGYVQRNRPKRPDESGRHVEAGAEERRASKRHAEAGAGERRANKHHNGTEYLHRVIYSRVLYGDERGLEPTTLIDHRDRNPLMNLRENLRIATQAEQNRNQGRNDREDVGVRWDEARNKWLASVKHEGKEVFVGRFVLKKQAIAARARVAAKLGIIERAELPAACMVLGAVLPMDEEAAGELAKRQRKVLVPAPSEVA